MPAPARGSRRANKGISLKSQPETIEKQSVFGKSPTNERHVQIDSLRDNIMGPLCRSSFTELTSLLVLSVHPDLNPFAIFKSSKGDALASINGGSTSLGINDKSADKGMLSFHCRIIRPYF